jgi:hypothetical protein
MFYLHSAPAIGMAPCGIPTAALTLEVVARMQDPKGKILDGRNSPACGGFYQLFQEC